MSTRNRLFLVVAFLLVVLIVPLTVNATTDPFPVQKVANCEYVQMRTPNNSSEDVFISGQIFAVAAPGSIRKNGNLVTQETTIFLAGMPDNPDFQRTAPGNWNGPVGSIEEEFQYFIGYVTGWIQVRSLSGVLLDQEEWTSDLFTCGQNPHCDPSQAVWQELTHNRVQVTYNGAGQCVVGFGAYNTHGFPSLNVPGAYHTLWGPYSSAIVNPQNRVVELTVSDYNPACYTQRDIVIAPVGYNLDLLFPNPLNAGNQGEQYAHLVQPADTKGTMNCDPTPTSTPTSTSTPTHTPTSTATATSTPTWTPTATATWTPSPTLSPTPISSETPTPTATPTNTGEPTATATVTPIPGEKGVLKLCKLAVEPNFLDQGEFAFWASGWKMYVMIDGVEYEGVTDGNGCTSFDVPPGTYSVREEEREFWQVIIGPATTVNVLAGQEVMVVFKNLELSQEQDGGKVYFPIIIVIVPGPTETPTPEPEQPLCPLIHHLSGNRGIDGPIGPGDQMSTIFWVDNVDWTHAVWSINQIHNEKIERIYKESVSCQSDRCSTSEIRPQASSQLLVTVQLYGGNNSTSTNCGKVVYVDPPDEETPPGAQLAANQTLEEVIDLINEAFKEE